MCQGHASARSRAAEGGATLLRFHSQYQPPTSHIAVAVPLGSGDLSNVVINVANAVSHAC